MKLSATVRSCMTVAIASSVARPGSRSSVPTTVLLNGVHHRQNAGNVKRRADLGTHSDRGQELGAQSRIRFVLAAPEGCAGQ